MLIDDSLLEKILLETKIMTPDGFTLAKKSAKAEGVTLFKYISDANIIPDSQLGQLVANALSLPYIDLKYLHIPDEILHIIPEVVARKRKIMAFSKDNNGLHVAMADPNNLEIVNFLQKKTGFPIVVHYATDKNIGEAMDLYAKDVVLAFEDILAQNIKQAKGAPHEKSAEPSIIKIVDTIIEYAYKNKASDVHLEPEETYSLLRFRIDGVLHDIVRLPIKIHDQIVTRIKILSNLRTDARQIPQDGKISKKIFDEALNLRVSIVPITGGEKVVLRLLSEKAHQLTLSDLGFRGESLEKIKRAYNKPYGMILATGPTGSGKTTTLYAILKDLNTRDVNIMTIEDPVEYDLENISQIQVNPKAGLNFANGLRSIVRQDPDIILVGEIRDEETAKIAVNSAMTGHLVLSTLHTNDAATTIPRLFDMGVEPFLVASSVNVIVGQRLVRRICEECRVSEDITEDSMKKYLREIPMTSIKKHFGDNSQKRMRVYKGKGCDICGGTGYNGRVGIYEVLEVDEDVRKAIVSKENASIVAQIAVSHGMLTMLEDGLDKVAMGMTTLDELIRATKE